MLVLIFVLVFVFVFVVVFSFLFLFASVAEYTYVVVKLASTTAMTSNDEKAALKTGRKRGPVNMLRKEGDVRHAKTIGNRYRPIKRREKCHCGYDVCTSGENSIVSQNSSVLKGRNTVTPQSHRT